MFKSSKSDDNTISETQENNIQKESEQSEGSFFNSFYKMFGFSKNNENKPIQETQNYQEQPQPQIESPETVDNNAKQEQSEPQTESPETVDNNAKQEQSEPQTEQQFQQQHQFQSNDLL